MVLPASIKASYVTSNMNLNCGSIKLACFGGTPKNVASNLSRLCKQPHFFLKSGKSGKKDIVWEFLSKFSFNKTITLVGSFVRKGQKAQNVRRKGEKRG